MLNFVAKRTDNGVMIQRHVKDLMGNIISATYKEINNIDTSSINSKETLERLYNESKAPEIYCSK
ncbi:hypothetical protein OTK49_02440 [Vibrio coralliirubri]|uniref:hypothetical protein n=1 Tax=Vibrio coralliirubri TaxID=1516159 RepID=UPI0022844CBB|nr:hypothetical protein [Vibrio coralliirubri]MCY9861375.1 hypothetical protein [Vibrio coralliirubri]